MGEYVGNARDVAGIAGCGAMHLLCCCDGGRRGDLECEVERELGNGAEAGQEVGEGGGLCVPDVGRTRAKGMGGFRCA